MGWGIFKRQDAQAVGGNHYLYIILPYFNYCRFENRKKLFLDFLERVKLNPMIRVVVVEATLAGEEFQLPKNLEGVFMHLGYVTRDTIWIKESLINLGVSKLPKGWKYVAWVDADLTFLNPKWAEDTIITLRKKDVVQLFQTCVNMGPDNEAMKIDKSFGYMHCDSGHTWIKTHKYGFWHPGFAWACTHKAYEKMGGLIDWGILGSGDHHMALALIGKADISCPGNISNDYKKKLLEFQERVSSLSLGYVKGTILHHWHGRIEDRKYVDRWKILTSAVYVPSVDIYKNQEGLVQLTTSGKRMSQSIRDYFHERNEDNMKTT